MDSVYCKLSIWSDTNDDCLFDFEEWLEEFMEEA